METVDVGQHFSSNQQANKYRSGSFHTTKHAQVK